jgi:hypothetical protein
VESKHRGVAHQCNVRSHLCVLATLRLEGFGVKANRSEAETRRGHAEKTQKENC